ncbi:MAG TPA: von Willebrand factor type A domain-containing protein [Chitinophagaceae bacterium]|nr:von Willebrand factor type A domain-containing protein [Chitinophagaceae bacterium]
MKKIILILLPLAILVIAFRSRHAHTVSGTVTGQDGLALAPASVMIKGTTVSTVTGTDGRYSIKVPDGKTVLIFSAVGYETKEEKIKGRSEINVSLKPATEELEEIVVTANGAAKARKEIQYNYQTQAVTSYDKRITAIPPVYEEKREPGYTTYDTEGYDRITENIFHKATDQPLSTFSIDVDAASYSNVRRFLNQGQLPPAGAVRIEEMINYFNYSYAQPRGDDPFAIHTEISDAPWNKDHKLVLIGLQGKKIPVENLPASNLVFLIDVSGSMESPNKLPLVKASMKMLVDQLREQDRVAIVVYAGAAGLVLKPTSGDNKTAIKDAIDNLQAGGSTAGGAGIRLAYKTAREFLVKGGNNRVILCTDGDFNTGESSDDAMERLIEQERKSGVFLTVLGYGMGNYKDNKMQKLADKGNGNHAYIDGMSEAKKVLVNEFGGTLFTIAKDVKLQIEFNPAKVQGYRLIGYENRMLASEDFNDDQKDAGELGSGHTVTALYEIIPVGVKSGYLKEVDKLKYQSAPERLSPAAMTDEIMTVKFRYKKPDGDNSRLIVHPLRDQHITLNKASDNFRFAAAVAQFGMLLRNSAFKNEASYTSVVNMAKAARGADEEGYRAEFIRLVESASLLAKENKTKEAEEYAGVYEK